ncbi:MAG: DUF3891 family protein [Acidobacteriota bacterium]
MIIAPLQDQQLFITQHDHAHLASQLLALWRIEGLPTHPRRTELLFAAREHDNGWREVDSAPLIRPDGKPHDFMTVPTGVRWDIWHRAMARYLESEPYATALIVRHALRLHGSHHDDPEWAEVLDAWRRIEAELIEIHELDVDALERDYRWIRLTDVLSLTVCNRWTEPLESAGYTARLCADDAADTLYLDPFPLAGATTLSFSCRLLPERTYRRDSELGLELAKARWQKRDVRIAPLEDGEPADNGV